MKRLAILLALPLAGCGLPAAFSDLVVGSSGDGYEGPAQAPAMEQAGLQRVPYELGMPLVACMYYDGVTHTRLTVQERLALHRAQVNYLADCGERVEDYVWGVPQ